jgi:chemotaxis protein histidine kinase CheA
MAISSEISSVSYSGNGSTTIFAYTFKIINQSDLVVVIADSDDLVPDNSYELTLDTDYTVDGEGEDSGGNVTLGDLTSYCGAEELPEGWVLSIRREVDILQGTELETQGGYSADIFEAMIDYVTMVCQQLNEVISRCVKVSITSDTDPDDLVETLTTYYQATLVAKTAAEAAQVLSEAYAYTSYVYAGNAETAKDAAEAAQTLAEAAQAAAETAQAAAETAETGSEAAQALSEAAQALSEAAQAAAETAQTAAEDAQTAAETAQAAAETAKTGAETAETGSEAAQALSEAAQALSEAAQAAAEDAQTAAEAAQAAAEAAVASVDFSTSVMKVRNSTGSQIASLKCLVNTGYYSTDGVPTVGVLDNLDKDIIGFTNVAINNNTTGDAIKRGAVENSGLNTTGASVGDKVYCTATGTLSLTPSNRVVGYVLTVAANGTIYINIENENLNKITGKKSQAISASDIDWSKGNVHSKTISGNTTFTFSNEIDGQPIMVMVTASGSYTADFPAAVKWAGGTAPTQTDTGTDIYSFIKIGSDIIGSAVQDVS